MLSRVFSYFINPRRGDSPARDEIAILSSVDGRPTIVRLIAPRCPTRVKSSTKQRDTRVSGALWLRTMPGIRQHKFFSLFLFLSSNTMYKYNTKDGVPLFLLTAYRDSPLSSVGEHRELRGGIDHDRYRADRFVRRRYCLRDRYRRAIPISSSFHTVKRRDIDLGRVDENP